MGGRLALTFANLYPQCVCSLILESASPGLITEEERSERRKQDQQLAERILNRWYRSLCGELGKHSVI